MVSSRVLQPLRGLAQTDRRRHDEQTQPIGQERVHRAVPVRVPQRQESRVRVQLDCAPVSVLPRPWAALMPRLLQWIPVSTPAQKHTVVVLSECIRLLYSCDIVTVLYIYMPSDVSHVDLQHPPAHSVCHSSRTHAHGQTPTVAYAKVEQRASLGLLGGRFHHDNGACSVILLGWKTSKQSVRGSGELTIASHQPMHFFWMSQTIQHRRMLVERTNIISCCCVVCPVRAIAEWELGRSEGGAQAATSARDNLRCSRWIIHGK